MVKYFCKFCNFSTDYKTRYTQHCQTNKHKKHLASLENIDDFESKMDSVNPNESKMNPKWIHSKNHQNHQNSNESKMNPIWIQNHQNESTQENHQNNPKKESIFSKNIEKRYICSYCSKKYSTNSNLHKHLQKCMVKKEGLKKNIEFEMFKKEMEEKMEKQKKEMEGKIVELTDKNKSLVNNITNINNTQNIGTINYLNFHFYNLQPIEAFLENLKNNFQLSTEDRKCLLNTYNECGIDAFAETFSIIMKKYQSEQVEQGLLPTMPIVCTDGNLRSIKEFHVGGWKTTQSNSSIDKMIDISNDQIYISTKKKVFITPKERKKIHQRIKIDNSLIDMENIKKKYENTLLKNEPDKIVFDKKNIDEYDFSNINDEYIEKYSKL